MAFVVGPINAPVAGTLLHEEGEDGWVYKDWRLTEASRAKMLARWPELDLSWVDLAAKEYAAAYASHGSSKDGFVGWRDDIEKVSVASAKLMKALKACSFPAKHSLGTVTHEHRDFQLYDHSVTIVAALIRASDELQSLSKGVDARKFPQPLPDLIIKLACQLRYAGQPWDNKFNAAIVALTTMTLDGLNPKHGRDIRSAVRDALKSGDQRLKKLR